MQPINPQTSLDFALDFTHCEVNNPGTPNHGKHEILREQGSLSEVSGAEYSVETYDPPNALRIE